MRKGGVLLLAVTLTVVGCHDPDRYALGPELAADALRLDLSIASLPADGVSRTVVTATIDGRTASENRKVTFKTSLGTLYAGAQKGVATVTLDADASGQASVELQSETTIGTARIEVSVGSATGPPGIVRTVDVPFVALQPGDAFTLSATPTTIAADGFSRAVIRVQLLPAPGNTQRTVEFEAFTTGLLFGPGESVGALKKTVTATSEGLALVELQSSRNLETARVQARALGVTRDVVVTFGAVNPTDIIRVTASSPTAPADGASIVRVVATIAAGLPVNRRRVRFSTTLGAFDVAGAKAVEITADGANRAVADLITEQRTGLANLRATLIQDDVSDVTSVQFVPALPDTIVVTTNKAVVRASTSESVTVTAQLLRNLGHVTEKTIVTYSAVNAAGAPVGLFNGATLSTLDGVSTVTFTPGPATAAGLVTIRATVGGTIVGVATIQVID